MKEEKLNNIIYDIADSLSENENTASNYLKNNNIDIEKYIQRGFNKLKKETNKKPRLTKSQSFFRRLVLAAEIVNACHKERTFGSVKFQKLIYLCEQSSRMNFSTNYVKQVAGPFDNKFMHSIKTQFKSQKWFDIEKTKEGKYYKVKFSPLENVDKYKTYYEKYYNEVDNEIQFIINTFKKSYTNDVELVATIFACWDEIIKEKSILSNELIIRKVYAWSKEKKKFSENDIDSTIEWMKEIGITPINQH